jgi:hypothetical protein
MRRTLIALALLLALCASASARQAPAARKIDEFGGVAFSDMLARLDNFAIELQNEPASTGVIAVYPEMTDRFPGWFIGRAYWAKGYLTKPRGLAGRVSVVNGGFRDKVTYELWVVPPGAEQPVKPLDWALELSRERNPILFDRDVFENVPSAPGIEEYADYTDEKDRHEPFVSALRADPAARGLIIAYATRRNPRGADRRLAAREKLSIMKLHAIGADRIKAIGGGPRKNRTVEYWIVPPGAEPPKPAPDPPAVRRTRRPKSRAPRE